MTASTTRFDGWRTALLTALLAVGLLTATVGPAAGAGGSAVGDTAGAQSGLFDWWDDDGSDDGSDGGSGGDSDGDSGSGSDCGFWESLFGGCDESTDPASFDIEGFYPIPSATAGETVSVPIYVMNTGDEAGTQTVEFSVNGYTESRTVTLEPGTSQDINFTWQTPDDAEGRYDVTISTDDERDTREVLIENPPYDGDLSLSVGSDTLRRGQTTPITATVTAANGTTTDVTHLTNFSTNDLSAIRIDNATLEAVGTGSTYVRADYYGITERVNVTVEAGSNPVASIDLTLGSNTLKPGEQTTATVTATYADGTTEDVTEAASLSGLTTTVVSIDGSTLTAERVGVGEISAAYNETLASTNVTVEPESPVESVALRLGTTTLAPGESTPVTVLATYANGSTADVTDEASVYAVNTSAIASVFQGRVTAHEAGTSLIRAWYVHETDEETVTVSASG